MKQAAALENVTKKAITIELPDGTVKEGMSWETSPLDIALGISKGLADSCIVAKVTYTEEIESLKHLVNADDDESDEEEDENALFKKEKDTSMVWDLSRPLLGNCKLALCKFDSAEGKDTFWHSSAHVLGQALEEEFGVHLTIGPPLENGFYYDSFMGDKKFAESDYEIVHKKIMEIGKAGQKFERLELSKEEALDLFAENPFKVQLITNKVPDGSKTSAYRCGTLIDLCRGPHLPSTNKIKAAHVSKHSSAYWLGKCELDSLQRVYAITFPTSKLLTEHKELMKKAAERDHRLIGNKQELFFFHSTMSPGNCFWMPMGTRIYNRLVEFMRDEYTFRGFQEVITPNIYSEDLFKTSGHYKHYYENMYRMDCEGQDWFLKPMNCPGHCMIFDHKVRSYKELPLRMASFGVLHRNEISGSLSGLTRVRRFQQDDAHIYCRPDQIQVEIMAALDFLKYVYSILELKYTLVLSTRPKKAMGSKELWDNAELGLKDALDKNGVPYEINHGDGAFYGPKIDVLLVDALGRKHQCGTLQLDFQLPLRFNLQYRAESAETAEVAEAVPVEKMAELSLEEKEAVAAGQKAKGADWVDSWKEGKIKTGFERPVMIHRAILGSVERMSGILMEHYGGKWPFWLSPRQICVVPVSQQYNEYAEYISRQMTNFGFYAAAETSSKTMNKKVREAQLESWNYIAVVGEKEVEARSVTLRKRDMDRPLGVKSLTELVEMLQSESKVCSGTQNVLEEFVPSPVEPKAE